MRNQVDFLFADKHQSFLHVDVIAFCVGGVRRAKCIQKNKFAISL